MESLAPQTKIENYMLCLLYTSAPQYEANREQTMTSRAAMEAYLKQSGAQLWIEHDPDTFNRLKKAPDYIE